jgi:hypothetical protein
MVQAIIDIDERTNRVLNILKAQNGLKDKSQAINLMAKRYEEDILEPALRPAYAQKLERLEKQKGIPFKSVEHLKKMIEG